MVLGLFFSCKEKAKETPVAKDSLSVNSSEPEIPADNETAEEVTIISSDFDKIQALANTQSDTLYITNYWATWCGPCVEEIPDFVALHNEYKDKKVKFLFVNVDDARTQAQVAPFVLKNKMQNVYQIPVSELSSRIGSIDPNLQGGIPVTVLQKGEVKEGFAGAMPRAFIEEKINDFLNKSK